MRVQDLNLQGIRAVIFDFDGVLADTAEHNYLGWSHAMALFGDAPEREEYFIHEGRTVQEIARILLGRQSLSLESAEKVAQAKDDYCMNNGDPHLYPQALALLSRLRASGLRTAIVSGGRAARLQQPRYAAARELVDALVTGDDVRQGKPSPEPYLIGAEKLRLSPHCCLVVENAPLGIDAALSAGMRCVGLCTSLAAAHLARAELIFADLGEFAAAVERWFNSGADRQ